jgi:hypothetical protein
MRETRHSDYGQSWPKNEPAAWQDAKTKGAHHDVRRHAELGRAAPIGSPGISVGPRPVTPSPSTMYRLPKPSIFVNFSLREEDTF